MANLKRLSGAKDVIQDDFSQGVGTFIVSFGENPKVKVADIKKELGKFELVGVKAKVTGAVTEKDGACWAAGYKLANSKDEDLLSKVKGKTTPFVLTGMVTEDASGMTLTLTKVEEPKK
jgi:hypothetical protein